MVEYGNWVYRDENMKRAMLVLGLMFSFCLSFTQAQQIYIAGSDDNDAVYWHNGRRIVLPKTGSRASASAIAVSGSNIYITGIDGGDDSFDAVYWLNGRRIVLPQTGVRTWASGIIVTP